MSAASPAIGDHVGRYLLLRGVGSPPDGHVFVAYDPKLDRDVILKLLRPKADGQAGEHDRLIAEAQALAKLSHPNVVVVYDAGSWAGGVYMTLEYVEGTTLDAWLAAQSRPFESVRKVLLEAARGLAAAHEVGIVHLDVRGAHVLVGEDGVARVLGFSLARQVSGLRSMESQSGRSGGSGVLSVVGRPGYVAPECYAGGVPSALADQFAFCVTAWVALLGRLPFAGETRAELERAVRAGEWTAPPPGRDCPGFLLPVLQRGLEPRPSARYPSMQALLTALASDPRRRRRKVLVIGGVAALGLGALGVHRFELAKRVELCERGDAVVAKSWNEAERAAVTEVIGATNAPYAESASRGVAERIDDYTLAWVAEYRSACLATRARGEQSERLLELRLGCLDRRADRVSVLVTQLQRVDAASVEWALEAAASLPSIDACADTESLLAVPRADATSDALREQAALAQSLVDLRRDSEALLELDALQRAGEEEQAPAAVAKAWLGRAELLRNTDPRAAIAALDSASSSAEVAGADRLRLRAYAEALGVMARYPQYTQRGAVLSSIADGVLERTGASRAETVRLRLGQASLHLALGEHARAEQRCRSAVTKLEDDPAHLELITAYEIMAAAQVELGQLEAALGSAQRSHRIAQLNHGPRHPVTARALYRLGKAKRAVGAKDDATRDQQAALATLRAAHGPSSVEASAWEAELKANAQLELEQEP